MNDKEWSKLDYLNLCDLIWYMKGYLENKPDDRFFHKEHMETLIKANKLLKEKINKKEDLSM